MFTLDLNQIHYSKKTKERYIKDQENRRNSFLLPVLDKENNVVRPAFDQEQIDKLLPLQEWNELDLIENGFQNLVESYVNIKFKVEDKIAMPPKDRKEIGKLLKKFDEIENGIVEISDEQMDLLVNMLNEQLPPFEDFFLIGEYLELVKLNSLK